MNFATETVVKRGVPDSSRAVPAVVPWKPSGCRPRPAVGAETPGRRGTRYLRRATNRSHAFSGRDRSSTPSRALGCISPGIDLE